MSNNLPAWRVEDVQGASRGEADSWRLLCGTWAPVVLHWCSYLGGPRVDADEAAQQVFIIVWKKLDALKSPDKFPSWLFGITRRVLANCRRSAWLRSWSGVVLGDSPDPAQDPERVASQNELAVLVERALCRLKTDHREILVLCDLQEFTLPEAAALLGIKLNTAKSRLIRARVKFAESAVYLGLNGHGSTADKKSPAAPPHDLSIAERVS